jgi:nitroimidazol reductase NimA-like FMN-containing flavoprotein (pyridoxamine 5'-phosphate oxidase superfamily)
MSDIAPSNRTRLRRMSEKADYTIPTLHSVLDAAPLGHIAYVMEGAPMALSTLVWREGEKVYWHGSSASRALRAMAGQPVCLSVTTLDGLVLARSAFEHSVQFRSAMVMGVAQVVTERGPHLEAMVERFFPGRWAELRPMQPQEEKATMVLALDLTEASCKVAASGPTDPTEDLDWPVWAGIVPMVQGFGTPQQEQDQPAGLAAPRVVWAKG